MSENLFIYHPHKTPQENKGVKYHIVNDDTIVLCGSKLPPVYSSNGVPITLEWYNANVAIDPDGYVCKKCAKKALHLLNKKQKNT